MYIYIYLNSAKFLDKLAFEYICTYIYVHVCVYIYTLLYVQNKSRQSK